MINVLVFPGGSEIGLEIHKALAYEKNITLFSAGTNVPNHASYVFKNHFIVPSIHEEGWVEALNKIITDNNINYVFPAYDDIIIAIHNNDIKAKIVSSPKATCELARSKRRTYTVLNGIVPVPAVHEIYDNIYPLFAKPDKGQGSEGAMIVNSEEEAISHLSRHKDSLLMENLPGREYTIDCFSDRDRGLLYCQPRIRNRIRNGITVNSSPINNELFQIHAKNINGAMHLHGAWFFQMKEDKSGIPTLLEVGTRIGGTMATSRANGVNLPLLSILEQERVAYEVRPQNIYVEIDRALTNRYKTNLYYDTVYVDYDDTMIVKGQVNDLLVRFLYQCVNKHIEIVLVTKHVGDLFLDLRKYKLQCLFDNILRLMPWDKKSNFLTNADSIFIDDSYAERKEISEELNIPVFDSSMLEVLMDERM